MNAHQYHHLLGTLDRSLEVLAQYSADLSEDDLRIKEDLEVIRSQILKAESGHPFPFKSRLLNEEDSDFDMTRTPWFK